MKVYTNANIALKNYLALQKLLTVWSLRCEKGKKNHLFVLTVIAVLLMNPTISAPNPQK